MQRMEALNGGKFSLSWNNGFSLMSFLSYKSMIFWDDFVSPYLDNCSFCLLKHRFYVHNALPLNKTIMKEVLVP
jgi:hypothetical protein